MTQKELLYVEDAYNHEKITIDICNDMIDNLEDEDLVSFVESEVKKHTDLLEKLECLLEEKANE